MQALFRHIDRVKEKPHHVRRKVALATASGITAFIAVAWFAYSLSVGGFAIQGATFADSVGASGSTVTAGGSEGLAGAAAAPSWGTPKEEPRIEIIDPKTSQTKRSAPEPTIIPF